MAPAHFHLLARDGEESLPFPILGSQYQPLAATHSAHFAGPLVELAHVWALGREEHPSLHPSSAMLCTQKHLWPKSEMFIFNG